MKKRTLQILEALDAQYGREYMSGSMEELTVLAGVGRKTANVIRGMCADYQKHGRKQL